MGLGERLRRLIDPPKEPNPDDWVVLTVVLHHEGPMLHSALEAAGIFSVLQEVRLIPSHTLDQQRVVVQQRDLAAAEELLAEYRST